MRSGSPSAHSHLRIAATVVPPFRQMYIVVDMILESPHNLERTGWLRAAVLGANDGIISTASLILGVASASASEGSVIVAGVAGLGAGAMSMATGEDVSVHSPRDLEEAALDHERA